MEKDEQNGMSANKMASALSDDQKLEGMFHRDQFRKWAEEYLKNLKN